MEKQKELNNLFDSWKNHYEKEYKNDSYKKLFEKPEYKDLEKCFFPDGYLSEQEECKILFVSRESRVPNDEVLGNNSINIKNKNNYTEFYMRNVVNDIKKKGNDGGIRYPRHMAAIKDAISKENKGKKWSDFEENNCFETLKDCGYMNLNKHGGKAKTPMKPFEGLVKADKCYIKKQIEIMNPNIIVLLGANLYDLFCNEGFFKGYIRGETLFETAHPNARINYINYTKNCKPND